MFKFNIEQQKYIIKWATTHWVNGLTYKKIKKEDRKIAAKKEKEWGSRCSYSFLL